MKTRVDVLCLHFKDGHIKPLEIVWDDGRRFSIDQILNIMPAASMKSGGVGMRYTCIIHSHKRYLFLEENHRWFVE